MRDMRRVGLQDIGVYPGLEGRGYSYKDLRIVRLSTHMSACVHSLLRHLDVQSPSQCLLTNAASTNFLIVGVQMINGVLVPSPYPQ